MTKFQNTLYTNVTQKTLLPVIFCAAVLLYGTGCTGYRVGNMTLYRKDIRTIYVPMFTCEGFRRDLAEQLTEAVVKRIESRTSFKVIGRSSADSLLYGRIASETLSVTATDNYGGARQKKANMTVEIQWIDRRSGTQIRHFTIATDAQFVAEFGQSLTTAQQQAIQQMAEQIVQTMEVPW